MGTQEGSQKTDGSGISSRQEELMERQDVNRQENLDRHQQMNRREDMQQDQRQVIRQLDRELETFSPKWHGDQFTGPNAVRYEQENTVTERRQ